MTMRLGRSLPPLQTRWREDAQLVSLYEDRVQLLAARYRRRLQELRPLLADFLLALLVAKPLNAFSFAVDYFTAQAGMPQGEDHHDCQKEEPTTGLQYADALFYYERESRRQEELAREEETMELAGKGEREGAAAAVLRDAREPETATTQYQLAKLLLADELVRAMAGHEREEHERRETLRVEEERQLRASLFQEAGFAELLIGAAADAAVGEVEDELRRREECAFRVHPVSIRSDSSIVNVYHDQRYGDDFEGRFYEDN